jgi:hypothetical protein
MGKEERAQATEAMLRGVEESMPDPVALTEGTAEALEKCSRLLEERIAAQRAV